jgi:Putative bacterial sensory transduction regulator
MARLDIIKPFVEKAVADYIGTKPDELTINEDGSIPIRRGSTAYYVRLLDGTPPMVQIYSTVLYEVPKSPGLLDRLNEINSETMFARAFWTAEQVIVATELVAESIDKDQIANACGVVGTVSDSIDDELRTKFGGQTIFDEAAKVDADANEAKDEADPSDAGYM